MPHETPKASLSDIGFGAAISLAAAGAGPARHIAVSGTEQTRKNSAMNAHSQRFFIPVPP